MFLKFARKLKRTISMFKFVENYFVLLCNYNQLVGNACLYLTQIDDVSKIQREISHDDDIYTPNLLTIYSILGYVYEKKTNCNIIVL